jgi:putative ABC transport system permease protein
MRNLRLAIRTLSRTPFVTLVAIASLALGIGANTAIFSLFDAMMLRSIQVQDPGDLVNLSAPGPKWGSQSCGAAGDCEDVFSYPMFKDLAAANTQLSGIAAHVSIGANVGWDRQTVNGQAMLVSGSYFPVLGLRPALGRLFSPADDEVIGANFIAVLDYDYWKTTLGGTPDVLNGTVVVNGRPLTIVGVAPRGFEGTTFGLKPKVFVPISMRKEMTPRFADMEDRRNYWVYLFGRLAPGVSPEGASAALNSVYHNIINDVEAPLQQGMNEPTIAQFRSKQLVVTPGSRGQSSAQRDAKLPLFLLFATTGVVLLIACANIANLLLARGASRSMEMAVRLSLGANRAQVLNQLLVESVVLALAGGVASLIVARWTFALIGLILPPEALATLHLGLRPSVLGFTVALSVLTGLLFGLFPALHSTRPDLVSTIRANAGNITSARSASRFRSILVTTQIALSMALLITAGLFLKSLINVSRVDLGVGIDNVVTFGISPRLNGYDGDRSTVLFDRMEEELAAVPGVTGVTASLVPLLAGSSWSTDVRVDGFQSGAGIDSNARYSEIAAGYFSLFGVPLIAGREFTNSDTRGSIRVAIVNETFARKFNLGRNAVGAYMGTGRDTATDILIVGLVQDAKYNSVKQEIPPLFFTPWRQDAGLGSMNFYVRTAGDPTPAIKAISGVVSRLDPNLPVENLKTMAQQVKDNIVLDRMISTLSAAFSLLATLLASVGLYGVLAYTVSQRTREFGVRMAIGANARTVRLMVLRQVFVMLAIGGSIGIAAALGIGRAATSLLFGLDGHDPVVFAAAAALLALFAFCAGIIPAHRASRVDPMNALRYE